jgi:hypothetical protein
LVLRGKAKAIYDLGIVIYEFGVSKDADFPPISLKSSILNEKSEIVLHFIRRFPHSTG